LLAAQLIAAKREGSELPPEELRAFLDAYLAGEVADYQMSAFLMAVVFQGLGSGELSALTEAIIQSGERLDFDDGGPPAVDKHSTGGVGDKVSLILAPLLAEAGLRVPMMSGRGLSHTGGTLDKLESIPGFRTTLDLDEFRRTVADVGCAMIGQTPEIAPLDGRLYALRDVTGTVESVPLIASSIVSKKVAEGIEALVLDVKCGGGAFMKDEKSALRLAGVLVALAETEGVRTTALVTGMDSPLGSAVGNAPEVREAIDCLHGGGPPDLREVTLALGAELLNRVTDEPLNTASERLAGLLDGGRAAARFEQLIERQDGDPRVVSDPNRLPAAPWIGEHESQDEGWVAAIDAREVGLAAVQLGAGRARIEQHVDPAVGLEMHVRLGETVGAGQPLVTVHARDESEAMRAVERLDHAIRIEPQPPEEAIPTSRLLYRIRPEGTERL
jgi:pyrimidine-nucleoside phosphorylase